MSSAPAMSRAPGRPPVMDAATAAVRARIVESARETWRDGANELTFQALGTRCRVCFGAANQPSARQFTFALIDWLARFEAKYSRFLPTSLISRINATAGGEAVSLDEETEGLFALCDQIHFLTRGAFDPATLPLIQLWNWKTPRPTLPRLWVAWRRSRRSRSPPAGSGHRVGRS
ncbi:MAG TPA: FAD:protein FMN transferase [Opitutaceae bacterium]|nr:FAD:protein FMN transferase [Opitutaceae bacterium]